MPLYGLKSLLVVVRNSETIFLVPLRLCGPKLSFNKKHNLKNQPGFCKTAFEDAGQNDSPIIDKQHREIERIELAISNHLVSV